MSILLSDILSALPDPDLTNYRIRNQAIFKELNQTCIIIDDDPTGNQTVHTIPLLTQWDVDSIVTEFLNETPAFFLLTNSRSLPSSKVAEVYQEIMENIMKASELTKRRFSVISRSDSTLRGHFPLETNTLRKFGDFNTAITVFIPIMFEGGRVTVNDIHYVLDQEKAIPVAETPFAKDHTFRYYNSNLKDWIEEKTEGMVSTSKVQTLSVKSIRTKNIEMLCDRITAIKNEEYCIVNALNYQDLDKVIHAFLLAEKLGKKILYRTSSSFIPSYLGQSAKAILEATTITDSSSKNGSLIIVGSYISKSSIQLKYLLKHWDTQNSIEINIEKVLEETRNAYLSSIIERIDQKLSRGNDIVIYTSRTLITGKDEASTIRIASQVSEALISIVQTIKVRPKYILSKGGITSHDIAVKGLSMKRSIVLGQVLAGVPVWKMGTETKFPGLPFIVFPGNVGDEKALYTITKNSAQ